MGWGEIEETISEVLGTCSHYFHEIESKVISEKNGRMVRLQFKESRKG